MTEPTTGPTAQADGITDEDRALFQHAASEGMARWLGVLRESCLESIILGRKFPSNLADVVAINNQDPANRAPYGQHFVE